MTHEFQKILKAYQLFKSQNIKCVLATVVALDGSSYRKPGVSMLIAQNDCMVGAVSGGCVEKEVLREAQEVFKTSEPKMMTYDGRYRLGCEGTLYLLIEPFTIQDEVLLSIEALIVNRKPFVIKHFYQRELASVNGLRSFIQIEDSLHCFDANYNFELDEYGSSLVLEQVKSAKFQLIIFGSEYDAVVLSEMASKLGWDVLIVSTPFDAYSRNNFPEATDVIQATGEQFNAEIIDANTALILMTHNYAKDLSYLMAIQHTKACYIGLLGSVGRREKLINDFLIQTNSLDEAFLDLLHGPAGLNIGAETPEEIALSICSEIVAVQRNKNAHPLKELMGNIHSV
ncbi:XdhC family protein [Saccharicrinis aurantiacus]|uniref:XdhC family protein n=1 Tax=Saccharicrinis aurantiacus TaxID=1849719 RepID=UPI000839542B|nr:XdhC/CoxI family protein [Saccharicrinis aurantiacus]